MVSDLRYLRVISMICSREGVADQRDQTSHLDKHCSPDSNDKYQNNHVQPGIHRCRCANHLCHYFESIRTGKGPIDLVYTIRRTRVTKPVIHRAFSTVKSSPAQKAYHGLEEARVWESQTSCEEYKLEVLQTISNTGQD